MLRQAKRVVPYEVAQLFVLTSSVVTIARISRQLAKYRTVVPEACHRGNRVSDVREAREVLDGRVCGVGVTGGREGE